MRWRWRKYGGNKGSGAVPGQEGGQFANHQVLAGASAQAQRNQNLDTRIAGSVRNEGVLQLGAGTLRVLNDGHLHNHGTLGIGAQARLLLEREADLDNHGRMELGGQLQLQHDAGFDNLGTVLASGARVVLAGDSGIENLGSMDLGDTLVTLQDESEFDNGERQQNAQLQVDGGGFVLGGRAEFDNHGSIVARGTLFQSALVTATTAQVGNAREGIDAFNNHGSIQLLTEARVVHLMADTHASTAITDHQSGAEPGGPSCRGRLRHTDQRWHHKPGYRWRHQWPAPGGDAVRLDG